MRNYACLPSSIPKATYTKHEGIPFEVLKKALDVKLGKEYEDAMLLKGQAVFSTADKRFAEGRDAGSTGDLFDLYTVVFTVSLFFGGLGLVFKTRIRWYFLISGGLIFVCGFLPGPDTVGLKSRYSVTSNSVSRSRSFSMVAFQKCSG
jgi:hypothetical protein